MLSSNRAVEGAPNLGILTAVAKALALVVPWGVIENLAGGGGYTNLGYTVGIFVGLLGMDFVPPRNIALWRLLLLGIVMSAVHPALHSLFPRWD